MTTLNDAILAATGGPTVNDGMRAYFNADEKESLQDAEMSWLISLGATAGQTIADMWIEVFGADSVGKQINDVKLTFWLAARTITDPTNLSGVRTILPRTAYIGNFATPVDIGNNLAAGSVCRAAGGITLNDSFADCLLGTGLGQGAQIRHFGVTQPNTFQLGGASFTNVAWGDMVTGRRIELEIRFRGHVNANTAIIDDVLIDGIPSTQGPFAGLLMTNQSGTLFVGAGGIPSSDGGTCGILHYLRILGGGFNLNYPMNQVSGNVVSSIAQANDMTYIGTEAVNWEWFDGVPPPANIIRNGNFATDTEWNKNSGWTIPGGNVAVAAAGQLSVLTQNLTGGTIPGRTYRLTWTLVTRTAGIIDTSVGNTTFGTGRTVPNTFVEDIVAGGDGLLYFRKDAAFAGSIGDVSMVLLP